MALQTVPTAMAGKEKGPAPIQPKSRAYGLYSILDTLGGRASLRQISKLIPASDVPPPKNLQELRDWLSSSCTSKGYMVKVEYDVYRLATKEEYDACKKHNLKVNRKWAARTRKAQQRAQRQVQNQPETKDQPSIIVQQPTQNRIEQLLLTGTACFVAVTLYALIERLV